MITFLSRRSRTAIRTWAQTGRRIPAAFPYQWDTRQGMRRAHDMEWWDNRLAEFRSPGLIYIEPTTLRSRFRARRVLMHALRHSKVTVVVISRDRARQAGMNPEHFKVISQVFGKSGLPMSLISSQIEVRDRHSYRLQERTAYFLTGYDESEGRRGYFLCELPPKKKDKGYESVPEALEALKPEAVKAAEKLGRQVKRQGDLFFVPMADFDPTQTSGWTRWGAPIRENFIWDTNHVGKWSVEDGKAVYVKGHVYHDPEDRQPDHKKVRLGNTWHLVVRNTVPIEARK